MVIMASLQLQPGVFALFYHYASGKYSKTRTSDLTIFFILGAETAAACLFLCSYYITNLFFFYQFQPETSFFAWIIAGILITLSITSLIYYFRPGPGTKLFISRKYAKNLNAHARIAKSRSDAFILGALSGIYELPFTLPLYFITSIEIIEMTTESFSGHLLTLLYIITPIIPLLIIRWRFQTGHNLADIERSRVKDKKFIRIILSLSYLSIAILFIYFRILAS